MTARLDSVLDTLLPGGEGFPSASEAGAGTWLAGQDRFKEAVEWLLSSLPENFETLDPAGRTEALVALEARDRGQFGSAVVAAYSAYYTRPVVLGAIEAACGYKARPPQPGGYDLPQFDPDILAVPKSNAPRWRDPKQEIAP